MFCFPLYPQHLEQCGLPRGPPYVGGKEGGSDCPEHFPGERGPPCLASGVRGVCVRVPSCVLPTFSKHRVAWQQPGNPLCLLGTNTAPPLWSPPPHAGPREWWGLRRDGKPEPMLLTPLARNFLLNEPFVNSFGGGRRGRGFICGASWQVLPHCSLDVNRLVLSGAPGTGKGCLWCLCLQPGSSALCRGAAWRETRGPRQP